MIGAQAANELLNVKGIKASFILTPYNGMIYISARSIDEVNVQVIMEEMGGGGHLSNAATQIADTTVGAVKEQLLAILKQEQENKE